MDQGLALDIFSLGIQTLLVVSAPILLVGLIIGLVIAVFQATTQIQEQTLAFVPKIFGVFITLLLLGPWILQKLIDFARASFNTIDRLFI